MVDAAARAPEFPPGLSWINVEHPLRLHDLGGHVVLLDFWTSSCIHCLHVLPTLEYLEQRFAGRAFVVVGVHAGKFAAERDPDHVRLAVAMAGIRHPVVIDPELETWRAWGARAWPTLALVDARGQVRFQGSGEPERERLARAIELLLAEAEQQGTAAMARGLQVGPEPGAGLLRFPTRVAVDASRRWLWVAETGRHRVLAIEIEHGTVVCVAGAGVPGAGDGPLELATFHAPRGLAVDGSTVFVADTGNHLVRRIDLVERRVSTVLGIGRQVRDLEGGRAGDDQGLSSPWGLCLHRGELYVAMAGNHQVWRLNPATRRAVAHAGSGGEVLLDGPLHLACFAQPSGLAANEDRIAVADSENSALRLIDLNAAIVRTVVGKGLFEFGDADGAVASARLQHPLDVAFDGASVLVADTYNDKIRRVDLAQGLVTTIAGKDAGLRRPEGIAVDRREAFVADTGNGRIARIDLDSGAIEMLALHGLEPPAEVRQCPAIQLRRKSEVNLRVQLPLPDGARLATETAVHARLANRRGRPLLRDLSLTAEVAGDEAILRAIPVGDDGDGELAIDLSFLTSHAREGVCHLQHLRCVVLATVGGEGYTDVTL